MDDMFTDDPTTGGFEAGFDLGTGAGLVNAALNALPVPTTLQLKVRHSTKLSRRLLPIHNEGTHQISHKGPFCTVAWKRFNSRTDTFVAALVHGTTIGPFPPCGHANIEGVVPCATSANHPVTLHLLRGSRRNQRNTELTFPVLFGNQGANVWEEKIPAGSYGIRALVNGVWSPFTNFTLGGNCS